jgi:hypothetical protein
MNADGPCKGKVSFTLTEREISALDAWAKQMGLGGWSNMSAREAMLKTIASHLSKKSPK